MGLPICSLEAPGRDVRVDLGRREVLVAEQLLDDAEVGAAVEQVRRERVAERRRRAARGKPGTPAQAVEPIPQAADAQGPTHVVQEDLDRWRILRAMAPLEEDRAAVLEVRGEGCPCRSPEEADPLLATLPDHPDLPSAEIE